MPPKIPEFITVHLGVPDDESAQNVTVAFTDYIKNVASSEIYPDWPENSIRANIYAQISYALNRIYTEWYKSRGYDFDITNTTQFDQKYTLNGEVFDNVSIIADEIFNNYIARQGNVEPLFAQFCNGTTSTCSGLSQWGTVGLANEGYTPYGILQYYYGDNIDIRQAEIISDITPSYPGVSLKLGDNSENVRTIQIELNRIANNYPAITSGLNENGFFDVSTENAVKNFQSIFNLSVTGEVNEPTWYAIKRIYTGIKGLGELYSEGLTIDEVSRLFEQDFGPGDVSEQIKVIQYYLNVISYFDRNIPSVAFNGIYDTKTENAVKAFQNIYGLNADGITGRDTWNALTRRYNEILGALPTQYQPYRREIYPGRNLGIGFVGDDVRSLQELINKAAEKYPSIPTVTEDGIFGPLTQSAVIYIQNQNDLPATGIVGLLTWNTIVTLADE